VHLQAIYYFRGAQAIMLQERFLQLYAGSAATYNLRDNYRSHAPIITVADSIRKHL
jgi:ATP-dependent exoDNAse (exonuclease V) beta subunit